ncbi:Alpha-ketoglutarate permease [Hafnia alvei]|nr:Alpha-ketoglutarate permease [Hafnia alvei]
MADTTRRWRINNPMLRTRVSVFWRLLVHHQATSSNGSIFTYTHSVRCTLLPYLPQWDSTTQLYKPLACSRQVFSCAQLVVDVRLHCRQTWPSNIDDDFGLHDVLWIVSNCLPPNLCRNRELGPALLLLARLFQGLSVGGEYGTSATYMSEVAVEGKRGFYASFQYVTLIGGQTASTAGFGGATADAEHRRATLVGLASPVCAWRVISGGGTLSAPFTA